MKKLSVLFIGLLAVLTASAGDIKFVTGLTWKQIKEKAAREKKMIFFDAYATWCGPCKYLESSVYTDDAVAKFYNDNFINVKFDMEEGEGVTLSETFAITSYPTLMFFAADGKMVHKYIGAMEAPEFISLGRIARDPATQYYTLKEKVKSGKATDEDFSHWISNAQDLDDDDRIEISQQFLQTRPDLFASKDLLLAVMSYARLNNPAQLEQLLNARAKIKTMLEWDDQHLDAALYRKTFLYALYQSGDDLNQEKFMGIIKKYYPSRVMYAEHELSLVAAIVGEDADKMKTVYHSMLAGSKKLPIEQSSQLYLEYLESLEDTVHESLIPLLSSYKFSPAEKGKEGWLYLMQTISYSQLNEVAKAKEAAIKAYNHPCVPQEYKDILKSSYEL